MHRYSIQGILFEFLTNNSNNLYTYKFSSYPILITELLDMTYFIVETANFSPLLQFSLSINNKIIFQNDTYNLISEFLIKNQMTFEDNTNISICVFFTVTPNDVENDC
jgi:hypothetical protein